MDEVTQLLRSTPEWIRVWQTGIILMAVYLFGLGVVILLLPERAKAFLGGFAGNIAVNTAEAVLRAGAGLALMGVSPDSRFPYAFFIAGTFLVISALAIFLLPGPHRRFAQWAVPFALRIMPVYGVVSILMAGVLVWAVFA